MTFLFLLGEFVLKSSSSFSSSPFDDRVLDLFCTSDMLEDFPEGEVDLEVVEALPKKDFILLVVSAFEEMVGDLFSESSVLDLTSGFFWKRQRSKREREVRIHQGPEKVGRRMLRPRGKTDIYFRGLVFLHTAGGGRGDELGESRDSFGDFSRYVAELLGDVAILPEELKISAPQGGTVLREGEKKKKKGV